MLSKDAYGMANGVNLDQTAQCPVLSWSVLFCSDLSVPILTNFTVFRIFYDPFLYARLKNGHIMLYPSASVRPYVNFFVSV